MKWSDLGRRVVSLEKKHYSTLPLSSDPGVQMDTGDKILEVTLRWKASCPRRRSSIPVTSRYRHRVKFRPCGPPVARVGQLWRVCDFTSVVQL